MIKVNFDRLFRDLISSPVLPIMYLFVVLMWSDSVLAMMFSENRWYIVCTLFFVNFLPMVFIERIYLKNKVLYYLLSSTSVVLGTYLLSYFIFHLYVSVIFISFLWILSIRSVFKNIELQLSTIAAAATYLYLAIFTHLGDLVIPLLFLLLVTGIIGSYKIYKKKLTLIHFGLSVLFGILCTLLSVLFLT